MRVALVNPQLLGHALRGTGIYSQQLQVALENYTEIQVERSETNFLPRDVDLYHFPYFDPFFLTLPWNRSKNTIVTIHDLIPLRFPQHFPRGIKGEIKWQIQRQIVKTVDAIITDSYASKTDILKYIGVADSSVHVIPLAPAQEFFQRSDKNMLSQLRSKYKLPDKFFLYVGDMNWNKNIPHLIQASTLAKTPLVIVSKSFVQDQQNIYNPWKASLYEAQKLAQNNPYITSIGKVAQEELVGFYQSAIALVFPSYYEGFGLPIVEAFATGCPIITTKEGSLVEVGGDAVYSVDPHKVDSIAWAMKKMVNDRDMRTNLIHKGKQRVKQFTWKRTAQMTADVYQSVLGKEQNF